MVNKKRSVYSSRWLQKYCKDRYVIEARKLKLRSRSWFKLDAINHMDMLIASGMTVIDLGSAPGGWATYVKNRIGNTGRVIACDVLPMRKISGVDFLQGDCSDPNVFKILREWIGQKKVHVVLSDMSPNITGISIIDVNQSIYLGNVALNICRDILMYGGDFLVKVFQGKGWDKYMYDVRSLFNIVKIRKPDASRSHSREVYIVAKKRKI
ncbi:23S rRNA (uridine(2552)-2'-O)-methyltransferase RlmE [Blochmannia endosymbiont of Camponotus sp.]|uniref:23S rRNA (uridine(2552)-2'-O)-methyltransferase RlmE n=1 Tax=Blochmannia endosymbiont of Camponotus sp. TaxID=700220 RepID=UPI0020244EAF|nr:23S rRNA (uridine(2552)-2'-O)-methyltransferase RlmE [Blochmannia endosymbiont of Camponotus sp.]URJ29702.1 23S rRNA (uridine(2552)-2'-O)-methyltransferase RlmE [Blochmannia endosymbiont of Camponotus sp.]